MSDCFPCNRGYRRLQAELEIIQGRTLSHSDAIGSFVDMDLDRTHNSIPGPQEKHDEFKGMESCTPILSLTPKCVDSGL